MHNASLVCTAPPCAHHAIGASIMTYGSRRPWRSRPVSEPTSTSLWLRESISPRRVWQSCWRIVILSLISRSTCAAPQSISAMSHHPRRFVYFSLSFFFILRYVFHSRSTLHDSASAPCQSPPFPKAKTNHLRVCPRFLRTVRCSLRRSQCHRRTSASSNHV